MNYYLLFKSLHLVAVISWMAGLLYLPRIFVYHVENMDNEKTSRIFKTMEKRLMLYIMNPAMTISWLFGILLILAHGTEIYSSLWVQLKLSLVIILTIYHLFLLQCLKVLIIWIIDNNDDNTLWGINGIEIFFTLTNLIFLL